MMDKQHNKYQGNRAATRFNAKKIGVIDQARDTTEASISVRSKTENHTNRVTTQMTNKYNIWSMLVILAATAVLVLIGLIVFIGGNIWELYPLLHQIEFPVYLNAAVVVSTGLALGTLILKPRTQLPTAIITGSLILTLFVIWHFSAANDTGHEDFYTAHPAQQKHPQVQKAKQSTKPRIAPHTRRRLCLDDGTDLDRIECQKQSGKKRNYTWATL